jgi:four helix bundle protein
MEKNSKVENQKLEDRLIDFASRIIDVTEKLPKTPAGKHLAGQLLRSGTSPALNYGEALAAESKEDFLHKLKICTKELRETLICLKLIAKRDWFSQEKMAEILKENNELIAIFVSSTKRVSESIQAKRHPKKTDP